MKSRARIASYLLAFGFAAVAPFVTGCAEEEAEGPEAAYPVGASTGPQPGTPPPPVSAPAPPQKAATSPQASPSYTGSDEVAVGDDPETPAAPAGEYADSDPSALTDFHSTLDPYGTWEEDSTYGTVWVPSPDVVGTDFVPYETAGHWGYEDDYVWVSDYSWGWAPFHYGRWAYVSGIGWEWIPGRRYAGAWVSWRYGWDDWAYVGWAPLPPTWCWHRGLAVGIGFVPVAPYAFVATGDLFARHVATRVVVGERIGLVAAHTRPWVPASPTVAGHVIAQPGVGGPPPAVMHIPASGVVGAGSNQGVAQARAFARPNAAATAGYSRIGAAPAFSSGSRAVVASYPRNAGVAPAYGPPAPSHFGGRLGAGFSGRGVTSAWSPARSSSMTAVPSAAQVARPTFASPASPHGSAPTFHTGGSAPSVASAPAFHGFSTGATTGGFHGGGGYSGGFHGSSGFSGGGSHGGGGFHGGGGGHGGGHR